MGAEPLVYLYCVTAEPPNLERVVDPPDDLYLVRAAGLCAVVCRVEADTFEPSSLRRKLEDLDWVAAVTTRHERIVEAAMQGGPVIPFRFATLFHTDESLRTRLHAQGREFRTLLGQLEDKAEWGVKAYGDTKRLEEDVCRHEGPIRDLDDTIRRAPPGRAFLLGSKRKELVQAALSGRLDRYAQQTMEVFGPMSFQMRRNKVLPARTAARGGVMILNAAFLVGHQQAQAFVHTAEVLNERYTDQGLVVECSGPWPPYNFCDSAGEAAHG